LRRFELLAAVLVFLVGFGAPLAGISQQQMPLGIGGPGRVKLNFNADWRFLRGDAAGAAAPGFDDSGWERVGLPHSFSIPYFQSPSFYVGFGWYRKTFTLPGQLAGRRLSLEFEGAFQVAEIFVNGLPVGKHRGGYTGFALDITAAVHSGRNIVAVRVNNNWDPTIAPRAGEHVFSGGLYRAVWLVATDAVHVPWTGTFVTTPEISDASSRVAVETEVRNDTPTAASVTLHTQILDAHDIAVATLPDKVLQVGAGKTAVASQLSFPIAHPRLWSPETPVVYRAVTTLSVDGRERDRFATEFGFRWFSWTADKGFFLNGKHLYFKGANVHQDQAGWGDAVTNRAIDRDVQQMKDAGFDFIRGSHYPHDPHFAEATDRIGMLFLSEVPFWGTAGFKSPWAASAYPTEPAQQDAFDANVKQQLAEMIRINRNHPSIVAWGMDNEVFFTAKGTLPRVRQLLREEVELSHQLDPTRPASIDGAQRGEIDRLGDIAGYNGDGAVLFPHPGIPSFVAEYGSTISDRPGVYAPGWGDLPKTPGAKPDIPGSWRLPWRSGEAIWCGFDHGSIAGRKFGSMGLVDYERLPKRSWFWYRNAYRGIPPPVWPQPGKAAGLTLTSSSPVIQRADGTDDVQLVVTVVDAAGHPLSNSPPVRLTIESGPGEFPTGRSIDFALDSEIYIRDGEAAIAMRSWQSGISRIRASSPGLRDAVLTIRTLEGPPFQPGVTALAPDRRPYHPSSEPDASAADQVFGLNSPTSASSSAPGHSSQLADDGDPATFWLAASGDPAPSLTIDPERILEYHKLRIVFPAAAAYGFTAEVRGTDGRWSVLVAEPVGSDTRRQREIVTPHRTGEALRITVEAPRGAPPGIAEAAIVGAIRSR